MKRILTLFILFLLGISLLRAQYIGPFDIKTLCETEFRLYDNISPKHKMPVNKVGKGVHVRVLSRSAAGTGLFRVQLDDGSIGWISSDACYAPGAFIPEAFVYLPPFPSDHAFDTVFKVEQLQPIGYTWQELRKVFGDPEGRLDKGFTRGHEKIGIVEVFSAIRGYTDSSGKTSMGAYFVYNKKGILSEDYDVTLRVMSGYFRNTESFPLPRKDRPFRSLDAIPHDVTYNNIYTKAGIKYGVPDVPIETIEAAEELRQQKLAAEKAAARKAFTPDSWKKALFRLLLLLVIINLAQSYFLTRPLNWNHRWRILSFLAVVFIFYPYPAGMFSLEHDVGFWGKVEIWIGAVMLFIGIYNFFYHTRRRGTEKCPHCGKWMNVYLKDLHYSDFENETPTSNSASMRLLLSTYGPINYVEKKDEDNSRAVSETQRTYMVQSDMIINCKRSATHCCRYCNYEWFVKESWSFNVYGPILTQVESEKVYSWDDVTKTIDQNSGTVVKEERSSNGYTDVKIISTDYDYDRYEPYYKRFCAGDDKAIDEYYDTYWPTEKKKL